MKKNIYFYFASPHSFKYPFYVYMIFKKKDGILLHRNNRSKWKEERNYTYYGQPVNCIIPEQPLEYSFVFSLLNSEDNDNVFGAINYMLCNYRERFIKDMSSPQIHNIKTDILFQYFKDDLVLR